MFDRSISSREVSRWNRFFGNDNYDVTIIPLEYLNLPSSPQDRFRREHPSEQLHFIPDRERTLDKRRLKDVEDLKKEAEMCGRMFQLNGEDQLRFRVATGLFPCETLVTR